MKIENEGDGFSIAGVMDGFITYREGSRMLQIYWEHSGAPNYDVLISCVLKEWKSPTGEPISNDKQKLILARLREWLAANKVRSDIDLPRISESSDVECVWTGCKNKALKETAFCQQHIDEKILGWMDHTPT